MNRPGALLAAMLAVAIPLDAAICTWSGASASWDDAGQWSCASVPDAGDSAVINSGTVVLTSTRTVARVSIASGGVLQVDLPGSLAVTSGLELDGTLAGSAAVSVSGGSSEWTGGTMSGSGSTSFGTGTALEVSDGGTKSVDTRSLTNSGTITWLAGNLDLQNGAAFVNTEDGVVDIRASIQFDKGCCGPPVVFTNAGLLRRSSGTGTVKNAVETFVNTGTIEVLTGSFRPRTFTNDGGTLEAGPDGQIVLDSSGDFDLRDGTLLTGAGEIDMLNGTMTVSGDVTAETLTVKSGVVTGPGRLVVASGSTVRWHSGTMNGSGTTYVETGGTLLLATGGAKNLAARVLDNRGTIRWTGGDWSVHGAATLDNRGLLSLESDHRLHQDCCPGAVTFLNSGTIRKSGTTGTSAISTGPLNGGGGTIEVRRGILDVTVPLTLTGTSTLRFELSGLTPAVEYGRLNVASSPSLAGAEIDAISLPWLPPSGSVFTVVTGAYTGAFSNGSIGLGQSAFVDVTYPAGDRVDLVAGHAGTLALEAAALTAPEDGGPLELTVGRTGGSDGTVTLQWTVTAGSASASDFATSSGLVSLSDGVTSGTFTIPITSDALDENDETFTVTLSNPTAYALLGSPSAAVVTIADDDPPPAVSFTAALSSAFEGDTITVKVALSTASGLPVTVPVSVAAGTTAQPADYEVSPLSIPIAPGTTSASITLEATDDALDEDDQTVVLAIGSPVNATPAAPASHVITILDDDPTPRVWFSTPLQSSAAESGDLRARVELSTASERTVTIPFTLSGTASRPSDYSVSASPLSVTPGDTRAEVEISIHDDEADEPAESVILTLGPPANATLGPAVVHTAMISDDDGTPDAPTLTVSAPARLEGDSGTAPFRFVLAIVPPASTPVTVDYQSVDGTALGGEDFTHRSGSVTFAPGEPERQIVVDVAGDTAVESDEQFALVVSTAAGTLVPLPVATATIVNDDTAGRPAVDLVLDVAFSGIQAASAGTTSLATVVRGQEIDVTATVRNRGARIASGIALGFTPDELDLLAASPSCVGLVCALDDLAPGASADVQLRFAVPMNTDAPTVSLTGNVSSDRADGNQADNAFTATAQIACSAPRAPEASAVASVMTGIAFELGWSPEGGIARYEVQESAAVDFAQATTTIADDDFLAISRDVEQMTAAFFRVRGIAACDGSAGEWSNVVEVRFRPLPDPDAINASPDPFVAPYGTTELLVQWILIGPPATPASSKAPFLAADPEFSFAAGTDRTWLSTDRQEGTMPAEGTLLQVTIDPAMLPAGTSTGTVNVTVGSVSSARTASTATVSIPISVTLVTPVAAVSRDLPPPESTLIIPAVANASGIASDWRSDVRLYNPAFGEAEYDMTFVPSRADASHLATSTRFPVQAGQTLALDDVLNTWFAIGTFNESVLGFLEIRPVADATAVAASRTYNISGLATLGQFIPAVPFSKFLGLTDGGNSILSLQQLRHEGGYRTNIGLVEGAGQAAGLLLRFFDPLGGSLGSVPLTLAGGQHVQLDGLLALGGASAADARAEIEVVSGTGKVTAYASVIDGASGDPMLVAATQTSRSSTQSVIPGLANLETGSHHWRSDVRLFNRGSGQAVATLSYYPLGTTEPEKSVALTLAAGEVRGLDDVLPSVFGVTQSAGAVHVHTSASSPLTATARTYDVQPGGTFGQFIPAVTSSDAAGAGGPALRILYAEESVRRRTNLGLVELSGSPVRVLIEAAAPDAKITASTEMELGPNEFRQLGSILRAFGIEATYNATITVRAVSGDGRVAAYASSIDNLTGDPTYIPAQ